MWKLFLIAIFFLVESKVRDCVPYTVGTNTIACICNATYCDDTPYNDPKIPREGTYYRYVTNREGIRMKMSEAMFDNDPDYSPAVTLTIDTTKRYQTILGFGGAFTDSAGINIRKLSPDTQNQLIRTYYCQKAGSKYSLGRIPIAGTDFSTRVYSYDDIADDVSLRYFALAPEDYEYKIPYVKKALQLNSKMKLLASSWSAPGWMKTNGVFDKFGYLKEEYYQIYANYLTKFVDEYKKNDIDIWAVTTGNEPTISFMINRSTIITMGWTPDSMSKWVGNFLGPTLASATNAVVLALDDDRELLPDYVVPLFKNENASKYTVGTGVHWYFPNKAPTITVLDQTHEQFPDKLLLMTESSIGPPTWKTPNVAMNAWTYGEKYILSIIEYINHWSVGWIDWNLALDEEGGPTWSKNTLASAIVVNSERDEFYKLPTFYAIRHFSRFVDRGSVRISITDTDTIKSVAFLTPSNEVVVVLYNSDSSPISVALKEAQRNPLQLELSPYSMNTVIYKL
ncbi:lysosomal acid glucosylceramidase-like [Ptiloglossa arizonensis]|uniref:lysosomal acid glucosylceramidase-like n=1 Tax=Ptiloglossa arizonensis TaxID=3350558 RepID=UPI003F9FFAA4